MNYRRWQHLQDRYNPPHHMDWRHVQMIHAVLTGEQPKAVIEIGCAHGFSTSAIHEALEHKDCNIERVALCDPWISEAVKAVHAAFPDKVQLCPCPSQGLVFKEGMAPDCWLIDGDHDHEGANADYDAAKAAHPRIVIIHDTHTTEIYGNHIGSFEIWQRLEKDAVVVVHDKKQRDGELTHRGLAIGFFYHPKPSTLEALAYFQAAPLEHIK